MIFLTFLIFLIVNGAEAELKGNCYLEGVTIENWSTAYTNQAVNDNEKIVFKTFNTANVTGVTVSGEDYSKYFVSKYEQNVVTIGPSAEFANFEKNENNEENPTMVVNLDFDCNSGKGTLAFYQEIADLNTYKPAFSKSSYSYKLPMPLPADFNLQCLMDAPIEACDNDITNTKLNFAIDPPGDFLVSSSGPTDDSKKCYNVLIKTEKPLTLSQTTSYDLVVTDIGNPTKNGKVEMKIEIDEQTAVPSNPQFNLAYYTATYDNTAEQHSIKVDSIISLEKKDQAATVNIFGVHKDNFDININNNVITVTLKKNLEDEIISENVIVVLTLEATVTNAEGPGKTALIIYMPKKECPTTTTSMPTTACPTTETPTECPICTTEATTIVTCPPCTTETPITPAEPRVIFFQDLYSFHTVPEDQITVGAVKAVAIPDEEIEYSIQKDGENVIPSQLEINKNTGSLSLNGKVDVGVYKILAEAKGINTGASNTAHVEISVYIETETADVLIVKTIDEDAKSTLPLPCPLGQNTCTYQLINQYPETSQVLFQYDNGNLITEAINLQMEEIKDYLNPQFTLNFKLTDVENTYIFAPNKSVKEENDRHWLYLPKSIPRDPSTLLVSVVVKDVNNHPPVFDVGNKLTVGYPIKSLINELSPPYLVQVHATDLDKGVYADIRFTTTDKDFIVHPKTGIIYPGDNAFDNNINRQFFVTATDMDGASGGLTASLDIDVKLLTQQHLTFLTIQDKLIEDLDNVLKELSIKTNLKINYLTAAIVPKEQSKSLRNRSRLLRSTRDDEDYAIKLIVYALDGSNELVQTEILQEKLDDVEDVGDLSTTTWDSTCNEGSDTGVTNLTGYIVGIAVLASLLVIFMIAVGVTYYVKIVKKRTPKPYTEMRDEDSKSIKSENSQQDDDVNVSKRRPTGFVFNPPPVEEDNDSIGNDRKYESISNNAWADPSTSSTYNDPIQIKQNIYNDEHKLQITRDSVDHINDEDSRDSPNSLDYDNPKKSVSFRPIVEKINIVVDTDKADTDDVDVHL
ncbi:hypothetical protein RN001_007101 [Aquatica leii]|uniref:Cadherin domain-containing protein n=1 Tax=Aquatica leii TaxID=1421715 RepID=A0AAN7SQS9_9COLE|nr:hypothetical protein RN001_007101 [Aquatica leii]